MSDVKWEKGVAVLALALPQLVMGCGGAEPIPPKPKDPEPAIVPLPTSGGGLSLSEDGARAYLSDPERDVIYVVDLETREVRELELEAGDEPGRIVEGGGKVHVALRRSGVVASFDVDSGEATRTAVCATPRGMAYVDGKLHVACASGELVTVDDGLVTRQLRLERDLRDVVAAGDKLVVSHFRSAKLSVLDGTGAVLREMWPPDYSSAMTGQAFGPAVAYRMTALPDGTVVIIHQRAMIDPVAASAPPIEGGVQFEAPSAYGGGGGIEFQCSHPIVHAAMTRFDPTTGAVLNTPGGGTIAPLVVPTDIAISPDGSRVAVAGSGNDKVYEGGLDVTLQNDSFANFCRPQPDQKLHAISGEPNAVAYSDAGLLIHTREPSALMLLNPSDGKVLMDLRLNETLRRHAGHAMFSKAAAELSPIACASCHPEGRDDGHTWSFEASGLRRTQNVSGGVLDTFPLHWDGDMTDMHEILDEVFVNRMGGHEQSSEQIDVVAEWLHEQPALARPMPMDVDAAERGAALFADLTVGCTGCHSGLHMTNNATTDVGTGKAFQVPSLVGVADRLPLMHDGCAMTLKDRFTNQICGGGDKHGKTSHLTELQIDDLVAYLETL